MKRRPSESWGRHPLVPAAKDQADSGPSFRWGDGWYHPKRAAPTRSPKEDAPAVGGRGIGVRLSKGPTNIAWQARSEEHTSELQSLMRISYAVFCLKKKTQTMLTNQQYTTKP